MNATWKTKILLASAVIVGLSGPVVAQNDSNSSGNNASNAGAGKMSSRNATGDRKFAEEAAMGGMMEVELGRVAVQKASNSKVKQFGQRMIDDHTKAGNELKSIAAKQNITLPSDLDATHKAMVQKFSAMSGAEFDRAYMSDMVQDHEKDVADFQKEASSGSNSDLKNWANTTLPTLQEHLRMAKDTASAVGASGSR